ncbi:uncharacterized protein ColSpa_07171 [Colletotrichum spaethianum]|uniref:Uncharacterized protein n=1 Tax=Colletotrichum spaethianum TaxID=700344 RepID=A0AA37LJ74_9PEZI|nr:uncharacterized protein ColSpa_07171 [Colletotrichum spaethianum]GKT46990.1 hypothetical protein ColSpa_07171 [Colletotrichum spaethianum]
MVMRRRKGPKPPGRRNLSDSGPDAEGNGWTSMFDHGTVRNRDAMDATGAYGGHSWNAVSSRLVVAESPGSCWRHGT